MWKDFQFLAGGPILAWIKFGAYFGLYWIYWSMGRHPANVLGWTEIDVAYYYSLTMLALLLIEASIGASRMFHDEIRLQTISTLLMLPRTIPYIAYSKAIGCLLGLLPAAACLVFGMYMLPEGRQPDPLVVFDPAAWAGLMTFVIFLHLVVLISLFLRWGVLPTAIFLMGPVSIACPVWNLLLFVVSRNSPIRNLWGDLPATLSVICLTSLVCFVFQMMIGSRIHELGTKS